MKLDRYLKLKSGSDVRGVAVAREGIAPDLTEDAVYDITCAYLYWLAQRLGKETLKIAVGHDVRISCPKLCHAVKRAITESGCTEVFCDLASTPSMFTLLKEGNYGCDGSVMITASHLPYYMNGLKFFTLNGGLGGEDIEEILRLAASSACLEKAEGGYEEKSFMYSYEDKLVSLVRDGTGEVAPLIGKKIIIDAGNGGGKFFETVLKRLGADTRGSVNMEPNGMFPAHAPNPEDKNAIQALQRAVFEAGADLGIIFDTDVDRAAIVGKNGEPINRDRLIALVAATILTGEPATIVTDSVTDDGLTEFIEGLGGKHVRFKRGYKNVIDEAKRRTAEGEYVPLAMETSGHAAFAENYYLDDGAYLVCKLLIAYSRQYKLGKTAEELISTLKQPAEEGEVRISFNENSKHFKAEGDRVIAEVKYFTALDKRVKLDENSYEGARLSYPDGFGAGWTLIRQSVHEKVLPINFASREVGGTRLMARELCILLEKFPFLDVTPLKNYIEAK